MLLIPVLVWAFRRNGPPGSVFWHFVLWYSVLRSVIEEPFRDNPLYWKVYLSEGIHQAGVGLFTLTQLVSVALIALAIVMLLRRPKRDNAIAASNRTRAGRG